MAVTREQILAQLKARFPDRIIYPETYTPKMVGAIYQIGIRKLSKEQNLTQMQWLQENGFIWRETGYVEPDMRPYNSTIKRNNPFTLADSIIRRYPVIGAYEPDESERTALFSIAQKAVQKLCLENSQISRVEELVLTLSTIQLAKNWSSAVKDEDGVSFWQYIYLQYGFNPENSPVAEQRVYAGFRHAIKSTLQHYHRYLAPEKTMRYYTSLLLHAVAPVQSIENLLDILFDFYVKNLDFQYQSEDPVYRTLVRGIQSRWSGTVQSAEGLQLRSSEVMSGLKTLFLERPGFMAYICETLVQKMDRLLRGKTLPTEDRWDKLLRRWYEKKSRTERTNLQGRKRAHKTEFIATTADRIFLQYAMENGQIGIVVPRIRLSEVGQKRPELILYQGSCVIWRETLSVTGNDLSLTTRRRFLPLTEIDLDWTQPLELCGEIEYLGEILFTSGSKLYRDYLLFDMSGNEHSVRSGTIYLFANNIRCVEFADDEAVLQEDHPGQLYRIDLDQVGAVTVDGIELFADEQRTGTVRLYSTISSVRGVAAIREGKSFSVFDRPFELLLRLPAGTNPLRYQLVMDGVPQYGKTDIEGNLRYCAELSHGSPHIVRVIDLIQDMIVRELCYVFLPHFSCKLNQTRYLERDSQALATLSFDGAERTLHAVRIPNSDIAEAVSPLDGFDYEIQLPTIHCSLGETDAFSLPEFLWKGDIDKTTLSTLHLPAGWNGKIMLGIHSISASGEGVYEIGNLLHSNAVTGENAPLWLNLHTPNGNHERIPLTWIILTPSFVSSPIEVEDGKLQWIPDGRFIGQSDARFHVILDGNDERIFDLCLTKETLCDKGELEHGSYHCEVFLKPSGLFSKGVKTKLLDEWIDLGDGNEFRFNKKELHLNSVVYWNLALDCMELQTIRQGAAILTKLRFLGYSIPSGESFALPEYEAELCFETVTGRRIPFSYRENDLEFEWVNPAKVWIVNERRLILRTITEDAIYFDSEKAILMSRKPERVMSKATQKRCLQTPDYCDYQIRGESGV